MIVANNVKEAAQDLVMDTNIVTLYKKRWYRNKPAAHVKTSSRRKDYR